jgi:hypothetical protein
MPYYHVHVEDAPGFSVFFQSKKYLKTSKAINKEVIRQNKLDDDDIMFVNISERISKQEYVRATR